MAFDTKPNLSNSKFEQLSGETLTLRGTTEIHGILEVESGGTLLVKSGSSLVIDGGTVSGITSTPSAANGLSVIGNNIVLGGSLTGDTVVSTTVFGMAFVGASSCACGASSFATGRKVCAIGNFSFASGDDSEANGSASHAEGLNTCAIGNNSHAEGNNSHACGLSSHAEGCNTRACGSFSHSEGGSSIALGDFSHAEGAATYACGNYSHSEGLETIATGVASHAEGTIAYANSNYSHAQGYRVITCGVASHSSGYGYAGSKNIYTCGVASFNHSTNTAAQTAGHGANAPQSAILGGINHNIESGNTNAAIIGGNAIKLTGTSYIDHTAVDNLAIMTAPSAGGSNDLLTWESGTTGAGIVRKVTQASISDSRLKNINSEITGVVPLINSLKAYEYEFNDNIEPKSLIGQKKYGLIAQELEQLFPYVVKDNLVLSSGTYKTVEYRDLVPILFQAIKELSFEINELKEKIK